MATEQVEQARDREVRAAVEMLIHLLRYNPNPRAQNRDRVVRAVAKWYVEVFLDPVCMDAWLAAQEEILLREDTEATDG